MGGGANDDTLRRDADRTICPPNAGRRSPTSAAQYGKDPLLALLLQMFGGLFGVADFYLGNVARGILMAIGTISGIGVVITVPLWLYRCCTSGSTREADNDASLTRSPTATSPPLRSAAPNRRPPPIRTRPNISGVPMVRTQ